MAVALHACGTDATPTPASTSTTTTVAAEPGPTTTVAPEPGPTTTVAPEPGPTTTVAPEPGPTTTVAPEPGPTTTVAPERLSAAEVYSRVSPSIPFIETATSTGSGILIEGGYVVTNYHVVWPHLEAWIVFPDGTELSNVPVVGWDPWIDLAVLGPVNVSAPPLSLTDGEGMTPGSELFLVGYPAETDLFPEPSITQGILSRFREWDGWEITLLQTDAAIAGGQSGGALTNAFGEVVGISTWVFSDAGFAVATSAADDAVIVEEMIQESEIYGWSERRLPAGSGSFEFDIELASFWDVRSFTFTGAAGSIVEAWIEGPEDGRLWMSSVSGVILGVDDSLTGPEYGSVELLDDGIHLLQVATASADPSTFAVGSSSRLTPFDDPDDGVIIRAGEIIAGIIDYHSDWDWYFIDLDEGDTVVVWTDAIATDTFIAVGLPSADRDQFVSDDDSGSSLFGYSTNAELIYTAPTSGQHVIIVDAALSDAGGGYLLGVDQIN